MIKNQFKIILIILFLISSSVIFLNENVEAYAMDTSLANVDASYNGEKIGKGNNGSSVSIIGDVNGDGYDDFLVARTYIMNSDWNIGKVYLIFGKSTNWKMGLNLSDLNNSDASFFCENLKNSAISSVKVAGAGDVNNDGYNDFLIGVPGRFINQKYLGITYLILGKSTGWVKNFNLTYANISFIDEKNVSNSGLSVAGADDVNGDGFDDFLIGALGGKSYLILGMKTGWMTKFNLVNANASFIEENPKDFAYVVAGAGDVDGNGYDDILIGASTNNDGGQNAGKTYLILGKPNGWITNMSLANANASFIGENIYDISGASVSGNGDVNNDGYSDFLIGAPENDDNGSSACKTYLIFGRPNNWNKNISLNNANASFLGESQFDRSGWAVSNSGDVNGDAYDDIIISAHVRDANGTWKGETYVILGKPTDWTTNVSLSNSNVSFIGEKDKDRSGYDVTNSGDVNNDGYDDILIGCPGTLTGDNRYGKSFLIFYYINNKPTSINSVILYSDKDYSVLTNEGDINQTIYVELHGTDGNSSSINIAEVTINSSETDNIGIGLRLRETGINTGVYQGYFQIMDKSHQSHHWIGAKSGEIIKVSSKKNPTKFETLLVKTSDIKIIPFQDNTTAIEDKFYTQKYDSIGVSEELATWIYESNATWLNWGTSNYTLYGTPTNDDVGQYWVRINISYNNEFFDEHNFTLSVQNVNDPPEIIDAPTDLEIKAFIDYELNFSSYIDDVDNNSNELSLIDNSNYTSIQDKTIIFNYTNSVKFEEIILNAWDGIDYSNDHIINVTLIPKNVTLPTVLDTYPAGVNVHIWSNITITFSKSMNIPSVNNAFSIAPVVNLESYVWNIDNTSLTVHIEESLIYNQSYTVNISSSAMDSTGNRLDGNNNGVFEGSPIDDHSWTFVTMRENFTENRKPSIQIDSPLNNSVFNFNDTIYFDCFNTTDPDNDILEFLWMSNISGILSTNPQFSTSLPISHHQITLYVDDRHGHNISTSVNIVVIPWNRPPIAIITSPLEGSVFNITDMIQFDASNSHDLDLDTLKFYWQSNISGGFEYKSQFTAQLPEGQHLITLFVNDGFYHNVSISINITVIDPSSTPTGPSDNGPTKPPPSTQDDSFYSTYGLYIGIVLIIIIVVIFGFAAATEVGKYGVLGTMVPLYRRLKGKKVLDNETRGMIRGYILANPGEHYSIIKRTLGLKNGTLSYHLKVLEQEGLIKSERDGIFKRFFPIEERVPENIMHISKVQELILNEIILKPGITPRELSEKTDKSHQIINYHLKKLISANLIRVERLGKMKKYYPVDE